MGKSNIVARYLLITIVKPKTNKTMDIKIKIYPSFIKWDETDIIGTFVKLFNLWEADRGAEECEGIFDLHDTAEFKLWADMYGLDKAIECYQSCQYWMGGCNFTANKSEVNGCTSLIAPLHLTENEEFNRVLRHLLDEIEDRLNGYIKADASYTINDLESFYGGLIDIKRCYVNSLLEKYKASEGSANNNAIVNEIALIAVGKKTLD